MTCLKLSGCTVGLLINFNVTRPTAGPRRATVVKQKKIGDLPIPGVLGD